MNKKLNPWQGKAQIIKEIEPRSIWRVKFHGSEWYAKVMQPINLTIGENVEVIGTDHISLVVKPIS